MLQTPPSTVPPHPLHQPQRLHECTIDSFMSSETSQTGLVMKLPSARPMNGITFPSCCDICMYHTLTRMAHQHLAGHQNMHSFPSFPPPPPQYAELEHHAVHPEHHLLRSPCKTQFSALSVKSGSLQKATAECESLRAVTQLTVAGRGRLCHVE